MILKRWYVVCYGLPSPPFKTKKLAEDARRVWCDALFAIRGNREHEKHCFISADEQFNRGGAR